MRMTSLQLICLRLYCLTFERLPLGSRMLRRILVRVVVKGRGNDKYAAAAGFFDFFELSTREIPSGHE
jgi:hypothetical protein